MGLFGSYDDQQQLPPWLSMYFDPATNGGGGMPVPQPMPQPSPMPAPAPMPTPDQSPLVAKPTAAAPAHTGFLARLGQTIHAPDFGMRLAAALSAASGNPNAGLAYQEWRQQQAIRNEELQRQLRTEQRTEQDQANQIWGLKESGNFSNPEIAAMTPEQRGAAMAARIAPYTMSPGQVHNSGGATGVTTTAPTEMAQNIANLNSQYGPNYGRGYAHREAFGAPQPIPQGGGLAGYDDQGNGAWVVPPYPGAPQQGGTTGGTARNNPGGLRYPGSTQFRSFPDQAAGVAAGQAQLGRYFSRGLDTVRSIIETWAPRRSRGGDNSDEQVNNYIAHVAGRLGVNPDQHLPPSVIPQFFAAQAEIETGHRASSPRMSAGSARGAPQIPVQVNSPQEAAALPPGTRFRTPDGREGTRN